MDPWTVADNVLCFVGQIWVLRCKTAEYTRLPALLLYYCMNWVMKLEYRVYVCDAELL